MAKRAWLTACLVALLALAGCGGGGGSQADPRYDRYVALGDSYTAAPGAGSLTGDPRCYQTMQNYPRLLAAALGSTHFLDNSCSGATTKALTARQYPGVDPQFEGLDSRTQLVTLGIGGNDANLFATLIYTCVYQGGQDPKGSPCATAQGPVNGPTVKGMLATVKANVSAALKQIATRAPHARIVLVGYPQIFPAHGTCSQIPLGAGDYPWARAVVKGLDGVLRAAAARAHVTFIDMWAPSAGHDICSSSPWIAGVSGVAGKAVAWHPFDVEQRKVADLILKALRDSRVSAAPASAGS